VQIELEAIGDSIVVHPGGKPAGSRERISIKPGLHAKGAKFIRRADRVPSASAANHQAKLRKPRVEPSFQRAHHRGRDAGGVPIHTHHSTEGLKPERIAQTSKKVARAVLQNDVLGDGRTELHHAVR
jgi:hypothetical protein